MPREWLAKSWVCPASGTLWCTFVTLSVGIPSGYVFNEFWGGLFKEQLLTVFSLKFLSNIGQIALFLCCGIGVHAYACALLFCIGDLKAQGPMMQCNIHISELRLRSVIFPSLFVSSFGSTLCSALLAYYILSYLALPSQELRIAWFKPQLLEVEAARKIPGCVSDLK